MQIPVDFADILRVLALAPILALAGGALGVCSSALSRSKVADVGSMLVVMPADVPLRLADPERGFVRNPGHRHQLMPMTYVIDLARNVFYMGKPEYASVVQYPLGLDVAVTAAIFVTFLVVGHDHVRTERPQPGKSVEGMPVTETWNSTSGRCSAQWTPARPAPVRGNQIHTGTARHVGIAGSNPLAPAIPTPISEGALRLAGHATRQWVPAPRDNTSTLPSGPLNQAPRAGPTWANELTVSASRTRRK